MPNRPRGSASGAKALGLAGRLQIRYKTFIPACVPRIRLESMVEKAALV